MRQIWWRLLCIFLLGFVVIFSFLVPLGPGLIDVDNADLSAGLQERLIIGYNTHFEAEDNQLQVFLAQDSTFLCTEIVKVDAENRVRVLIDVPDSLQNRSFSVFVNNTIDGTLLLENAFFASGSKVAENAQFAGCKVIVTNNENTLFAFPFQPTIFETIRNLMFHVPMWFTMFVLMFMGFWTSIQYLVKSKPIYDVRAESAVKVGIVFCILGLITGSLWARFTWGAWWVSDPQLNGAFITFLIYAGYLILRRSIEDEKKRGRVAAVYSIFAYLILFILLMVLPRFTESLHPGKGGNPGFNSYDLDSSLRMVFYPAVIGWILLGIWFYSIQIRMNRIRYYLFYDEKI